MAMKAVLWVCLHHPRYMKNEGSVFCFCGGNWLVVIAMLDVDPLLSCRY